MAVDVGVLIESKCEMPLVAVDHIGPIFSNARREAGIVEVVKRRSLASIFVDVLLKMRLESVEDGVSRLIRLDVECKISNCLCLCEVLFWSVLFGYRSL